LSTENPGNKKQASGCAKWMIRFFFLALIIYLIFFWRLPGKDEIKNYQPVSTVNPSKVNWSTPFRQPVSIYVPLRRISPWLQKAVIISEDDTFYLHNGINLTLLKEAFRVNWKKKRYVRGASTITMQLARNAFLHRKKTIIRKIKEMILARRIENVLNKRRILELYLNIAEWGENIYGAEAAAHYYFGKTAADLTLAEASLLASMLPNPKYFNPLKRLKSCKRMQKRVLWLLANAHEITPEDADFAWNKQIYLRGANNADETGEIDPVEEEKYVTPLPPTSPRMNLLPRDSLIQLREYK